MSFALIASLYFVYNLNFYEVLFGSLLASLLVIYLSYIIGKPSQKHGIPFPVFLRVSSGYQGAKFISLIGGIVGIFLFGVQTYFISKSIGYLIRISLFQFDSEILNNDIFFNYFMTMNLIDWVSFVFTIFIQYFLFSRGQKFIRNFINFSALFVYLGLLLFFVVFLPILLGFVLGILIFFFGDCEYVLVVGSLIWSVGGTFFLILLGIILRLVGVEYDLQKQEAAYRKMLVIAEDDETVSPKSIEELFDDVRKIHFFSDIRYLYFNI